MNCLQLSDRIIHDVLVKNASFAVVSKYVLNFKGVDNSLRNDATSVAGSALRHYFVFSKKIDDCVGELPLDTKISCLSYLSNHIFVHKLDDVKEEAFLNTAMSLMEEKKNLLILSNITKDDLMVEGLDKESNEFLSLRYNVPQWTIKMWKKHYGENLSSLLLRGISSKMQIYIKKIEKDYNFEENCDFEESKFPGIYKYLSKSPLVGNSNFTKKEIFAVRPAFDYMMDKVDVDAFRGIGIFVGCTNPILLELASRTSYLYGADVVCSSSSSYREMKTISENYHLSKVNCFEGKPNTISLCVSKKVHTFFAFPNSTNFALLRTTPDYAVRIKMEDIDKILAEEKEALDESSKMVENGGWLIYGVPTMNKKESSFLIKDFLSNHEDFILKEERQFFPFDRFDSVFYFAVLIKK